MTKGKGCALLIVRKVQAKKKASGTFAGQPNGCMKIEICLQLAPFGAKISERQDGFELSTADYKICLVIARHVL